jgi:hypothetical protein
VSKEPGNAIANPWTERILAAVRKQVDAIIEVGRLLTEAKADLPHGEFQRMVERDLPFNPGQARVYMRVAADPRLAKRQHAAVLPPAVGTLEILRHLSDREFERGIQAGDIHPDMSRKQAQTLLKGQQLSAFTDTEFFLSGSGRELERAIEEDEFAPHWLKLNDASRAIIDEVVASVRKLKPMAARVGEPDGVKKFHAEFAQMEIRVTKLAEEYRQVRLFLQRLLADADASLRNTPDD